MNCFKTKTRASSQPRDGTLLSFISCTGGQVLYWCPPGKPRWVMVKSPFLQEAQLGKLLYHHCPTATFTLVTPPRSRQSHFRDGESMAQKGEVNCMRWGGKTGLKPWPGKSSFLYLKKKQLIFSFSLGLSHCTWNLVPWPGIPDHPGPLHCEHAV